ncbi:hypothetical protein GQ607_005086 [Colletotrichum asianum]|uniref:Uncharacterized protein n=1 Tax=Colletotrichum asianum TaxID=702518 RepID=A0A8H3WN38_9PEZI|nr:hypothetical protein GQ607_005086 [Colletotrichum asianum]
MYDKVGCILALMELDIYCNTNRRSRSVRYHWALMIGPKHETHDSHGWRCHARERLVSEGNPPVDRVVWNYECDEIPLIPTSMILVRVVVAKVKNTEKLLSKFDNTTPRQEENYNRVKWVQEAYDMALGAKLALGTSAGDWSLVRDTAMWYVEKKKLEHRFDGRVQYDSSQIPTWDMLENKELAL